MIKGKGQQVQVPLKKDKDNIRVRMLRELCGLEAGTETYVDEHLLACMEHDGYAVRVREDTIWDVIGEDE